MVEEICHICNDRATGKHYGAISCDGCKGFFRRSIRKKRSYACRFEHTCAVDKNHRNSCRACRLRKCLMAGMKSNAIQNERDAIGKRKKPSPSVDTGGGPEINGLGEETVIELLLQSERLCQQLRSSVIKSTEQVTYDAGKTRSAFAERFRPEERRASIDDIGKSIRQQLLLLVEWAKSLPQFLGLSVMDQAVLLKANATQIIVLGVAYRSVSMELLQDAICLANDALISREHAALVGDINCVVRRILDELVVPIRRLSIEPADYVALKAIVFFNPVSNDVTDYEKVDGARLECLAALEKRCARLEECGALRCRLGRLLLLLPPLQAIAQQLIEDVQLAAVFGVANVDALMQELILQDASANNVITTLSTTANNPQPIKTENLP
ncbi:unnamed protein product, partial [Mesorhabditis spiculigera]